MTREREQERDEEVQVDARHLLALRRFPGFANHDPGDLSQMLQVFHEELFPRGSVLYQRTQPIASVYFVLEGHVTVTHEGHTHDLDHGPLGVLEMLAQTRLGGAVAATDVLALVAAPADLLDLFDERYTLLSMSLQSLGAEIIRQLSALPPGRWPRLEWTAGREPPARTLGLVEKLLEIRHFPRWAGVRLEALAELARSSEEVTHAADTVLWRRGEGAGHLLLILGGTIDAVLPSGRVAIRAGDEAGMVETLALAPRWYDAVVAQPIRALRLGHDALLDAIEDQADLGIALLRSLAGDMIGLDAAQAGA